MMTHTDICLYLDFYSQLLTSHARDILELYYGEDMTLSEIAEHLGITRQAVHDRIRQATCQLTEYERLLGLSERYQKTRGQLRLAIEAIDSGHAGLARDLLRRLETDL